MKRFHTKKFHTKKITGGSLPKMVADQMDSIKIKKLAAGLNNMSFQSNKKLTGKRFTL
jgi:hypothetical protein